MKCVKNIFIYKNLDKNQALEKQYSVFKRKKPEF